jgi:hypothetical protein
MELLGWTLLVIFIAAAIGFAFRGKFRRKPRKN